MIDRRDRLTGVLLGTAVGDALGLPREGLSKRRAKKIFGSGALDHRLIAGRGMTSDDTEHACLCAQALLATRNRGATIFARSLAWRLRGWLLGLPGGVGFGTLRALIKLWLFFPPSKSGVRSAGNGPAMRAPILGAYAKDRAELESLVRASTLITHQDPRAEEGALVVAVAAAHAIAAADPGELEVAAFFSESRAIAKNVELARALELLEAHLARGSSVDEVANALGLEKGVSGYINHTVPIVIYAWLRHRHSFRDALEATIALGGDTDTTGAILGGLMGATLGVSAIPEAWIAGLAEWPRSVAWMSKLGDRLASSETSLGPLPVFLPAILLRNIVFLAIVLGHGFRRLFPPY